LLIIATAVWVALLVADRLIKPVNNLVETAQKIADGNLSARVEEDTDRQDEVALLSRSFNAMTTRLETQTSILLNTNQQLEDRRAFMEAVLESVSAGVISIDRDKRVTLANSSAEALLSGNDGSIVGKCLEEVAPKFSELLAQEQYRSVVQIGDGAEPQTLALRISEREAGFVITFEDISQQLADQRRAAWSDVARRIAHEIKNPLTPIQLAAERLQRRFAKKLESDADDSAVFAQLTETIVRQVNDLRNIADEFSSFARMPKPVFREESLSDILAHAVFLFEVAHTEISFSLEKPDKAVTLTCDRRQLGQAITNLLKNAAEAVEDRQAGEGNSVGGEISIALKATGDAVAIEVGDNGTGFPKDRERILEPYVTNRKTGTGLGLAIVQKIVAEHFGEIELDDAAQGGALVRIILHPKILNDQGNQTFNKLDQA
jgi:two-component system nitrogen regulation sensor histidine kinase NtrY